MRASQVAIGALKSALPFQTQLRRAVRRIRPYDTDPGQFWWTVVQGLDGIGHLRQAGGRLTGDVLELGSGWLPVVPLLYRIAGARSLTLTDVERLMDSETVSAAKGVIGANLPMVAEKLGVGEDTVRGRLDEPFSFSYEVPWDPSRLADRSIDVVISRSVLEHIPAQVLATYLRQFQRILRPGGMMYHLVDNSDHWEHDDKTLSRVNMLRYEETDWRWRLALRRRYQNRLRHSDYIELFAQAGWSPVVAEPEVDEKSLQALDALPLSRQFRAYDRRDLATVTSSFLLRRTAERPAAE